jgi:hypothetical protein
MWNEPEPQAAALRKVMDNGRNIRFRSEADAG